MFARSIFFCTASSIKSLTAMFTENHEIIIKYVLNKINRVLNVLIHILMKYTIIYASQYLIMHSSPVLMHHLNILTVF